ncbi:MAG: hypothetical protein EBS56_02690 [Planctomycetia bacterium]|nr:hypothetical protein [Planctomycetia bacterium]
MQRFMRRSRKDESRGRLGIEGLEHRAAMAVVSAVPGVAAPTQVSTASVPTIQLCACSDSGVKGDAVTSAVAPRFTGTAAPLTTVTLALDGGPTLGTVRANGRGAWSFVSRRVAIPEGTQVIRATATSGAVAGSTTITFDRQKPTASIEFTGIDSFRVTFDRPVTGFDQRLRGLYASGRPIGAAAFNLPFTSPRLRSFVGPIEFTESSAGRVYDVRMPQVSILSGTFRLRLVAAQSGVFDAVNGNRLGRDATSTAYTVT